MVWHGRTLVGPEVTVVVDDEWRRQRGVSTDGAASDARAGQQGQLRVELDQVRQELGQVRAGLQGQLRVELDRVRQELDRVRQELGQVRVGLGDLLGAVHGFQALLAERPVCEPSPGAWACVGDRQPPKDAALRGVARRAHRAAGIPDPLAGEEPAVATPAAALASSGVLAGPRGPEGR